MHLLDQSTALPYLVEVGLVGADERVEIAPLSGGVSNVVLLVRRDPTRGESFVLKQARPQLRVPQPWFCGVERMLREIDVLRLCEQLIGEFRRASQQDASKLEVRVATPEVLHEDRANFALAMTAAPVPHRTWKECLLSGETDQATADAAGQLLGWIHARTWHDDAVAQAFEDRQFFDALRIDPYYRQIALVHEDLRSQIQQLIDSVWAHRCCLVHGDFSPKNLLVWDRSLMLIDFEVGHFGDPAFDLGFLFTHLVLKTLYHGAAEAAGRRTWELAREFWRGYQRQLQKRVSDNEWIELSKRTALNVAGCCLARVDGKSRVDYLADTEPPRALARQWLLDPPASWDAVLALGLYRQDLENDNTRT